MSIQCQYCKKFYASKQSLKNHQKTTKKDLANDAIFIDYESLPPPMLEDLKEKIEQLL